MRVFKQLRTLLTVTVLIRSGWFATIAFMPLYLQQYVTRSPGIIGLIVGAGVLGSSLMGVIGGPIIDRNIPKKGMLVAIIALIGLFITYYLTLQSKIVLLIWLNVFLIGGVAGIFELASKVYISLYVESKDKIPAFSLRYSAINCGAMIGLMVGAWLILKQSYWLFLFSISMFLISLPLIYFSLINTTKITEVIRDKLPLVKTLKILIKDKTLIILTIGAMLYSVVYSQTTSTIPLTLSKTVNNYNELYATIFSLNGFIVLALSTIVGFILHKFRLFNALYLSLILICTSFTILAYAKHASQFIVFIILLSVGEVLYALISNLLIDKIAKNNLQGVYYGIANFSMIGSFLGPVVGGFGLQYLGSHMLYLVIAILVAIMALQYKLVQPQVEAQ